jgi:hypothetical protein
MAQSLIDKTKALISCITDGRCYLISMNNEATKSLIWKATFTQSFCDWGNRDKAERAANAAVEYFVFTSLANQKKS